MPIVTLQPDETESEDVVIWSATSDTNYGTSTSLTTGTGGRALLRFDLSAIPATATCVSAVLSLWSAAASGAATYQIYSLAAAVTTWAEMEATWNVYKTGSAWPGSVGANTSGTDFEADANPPTITYPNFLSNTEAQADLLGGNNLNAARIQGWFGSPNSNYGIIIRSTTAGNRNWHSSAIETASMRPKLVVEYTESEVDPPITLTPDPASAGGQVLPPTTLRGSVWREPGPVGMAALTVAPLVLQGDVILTPSAAQMRAMALGPAVLAGQAALSARFKGMVRGMYRRMA